MQFLRRIAVSLLGPRRVFLSIGCLAVMVTESRPMLTRSVRPNTRSLSIISTMHANTNVDKRNAFHNSPRCQEARLRIYECPTCWVKEINHDNGVFVPGGQMCQGPSAFYSCSSQCYIAYKAAMPRERQTAPSIR